MNKDSQLMLVQGNMLTERDMMSAIDGVLEQLYQTGNVDQAVKVVNVLDRVDVATGKAKAKLLHGMAYWWQKNKSEDFSDYVESVTGTKKITVERYVVTWECVEQEMIPKKICDDNPMRELVPIARMLSQGYEPSKEQWKEIQIASNSSEISEIIRKIKNQKPRKSGLTITLEKDGSLYSHLNNKRTYIGFLVMDDQSPDVLKAQERIIAGAHIIRR